jgi:hypothetical protein
MKIINSEYRELQQQVSEIAGASITNTKNLTDLLNRSTHLQDLLVQCHQAAQGRENDLTKQFVRHLSRNL